MIRRLLAWLTGYDKPIGHGPVQWVDPWKPREPPEHGVIINGSTFTVYVADPDYDESEYYDRIRQIVDNLPKPTGPGISSALLIEREREAAGIKAVYAAKGASK